MSATPSGFPFPLTGDAFIDVITTGYKWNLDYTRTINWAIADGFYGEYWKSPATVRHELQHAFDAFSYFANVTFSYTGYFDDPQLAALAGAQMTVSMDGAGLFMSGWNIWACGFFPTTDFDAYYGQPGDVFLNLNSDANYLPSYSPGTTGFALILHELGHALGLKHTHDDGGTGRPTIAQITNEDLDHDWFSIMSYGDDYPWNLLQWHPATPMALDALGLMYLYGPNMSTNAGDSTFPISTLDDYLTVWDAGGTDTIDCRNTPFSATVALEIETDPTLGITVGFVVPTSDLDLYAPLTLYWLLGTYEYVQGSAYGDTIAGNAASNVFFGNHGDDVIGGGAGDDAIDGGAGLDLAVYAGALGVDGYTVRKTAGGHTVSGGGEGTDTLTAIEKLFFEDYVVNLTVQAAAGAIDAKPLQRLEELYVGFFNRVPDADGLEAWIGQYRDGKTLEAIADQFYDAGVYFGVYDPNMTDAEFITLLYANVLGRSGASAPNAEEIQAWQDWLAGQSKGAMVLHMLDVSHDYYTGDPNVGWVVELLDNKAEVANVFAVQLGLNLQTPEESIEKGMQIAAAVTPTDTSAALELIGVSTVNVDLA